MVKREVVAAPIVGPRPPSGTSLLLIVVYTLFFQIGGEHVAVAIKSSRLLRFVLRSTPVSFLNAVAHTTHLKKKKNLV